MTCSRRFSVNSVKEVLRLKFEEEKSNRMIGKILKISKSTVATYLSRANEHGIKTYADVVLMPDEELRKKIFFDTHDPLKLNEKIDFKKVHDELKRKHVTLKLLYKELSSNGEKLASYSHFCRDYRSWRNESAISMRQKHVPGQKMFIDYAGTTVPVYDSRTGEIKQAQVFVAVLGASNYTYAEATESQNIRNFLRSNINAFEYFNGCPELLVPDNLKSGVIKACRYEPTINKSFKALSEWYGATVIPARVKKPKDKAKVEGGVNLASIWILAALRDRKFFTVDELNSAIWELLEVLNGEEFQKREGSRRSNFLEFEQPALKQLPSGRLEIAEWKAVKANIDYHIEVDHCYYSVPFKYRNKKLDARYTDSSVEIFHGSIRLATHPRHYKKGMVSTIKEHMPPRHSDYGDWTPSRMINWGIGLGPYVGKVVEQILTCREHPELGFRSCFGILKLEKHYSKERLDNACRRALEVGCVSYRSIKSILEKGLDAQKVEAETASIDHENIRGPEYFH